MRKKKQTETAAHRLLIAKNNIAINRKASPRRKRMMRKIKTSRNYFDEFRFAIFRMMKGRLNGIKLLAMFNCPDSASLEVRGPEIESMLMQFSKDLLFLRPLVYMDMIDELISEMNLILKDFQKKNPMQKNKTVKNALAKSKKIAEENRKRSSRNKR